jgi:hypothetical protein
MLLQALFLVAFWTGIGILHKQSLAYSAAAKRLEVARQVEGKRLEAAKRVEGKWQTVDRDRLVFEMQEGRITIKRVEGKWQTDNRDGLVLEMRERQFTITQNGYPTLHGDYSLSDRTHPILPRTSSGHTNAWILHDAVSHAELVFWSDDNFQMTALMKILEREGTDPTQDEGNVWRFTRVKK